MMLPLLQHGKQCVSAVQGQTSCRSGSPQRHRQLAPTCLHSHLPLATAQQDPEAKIKARQDALEGPIKVKFASLTKLIKDAGGKFLTGDQPTYAE